jgi:hypothetical protein
MFVFGLAATIALAEEIKDAGSFDAAYVKRDMLPVPDQEAHALLLTESNGMSSNPGGLIDGFQTTVYETADLRQGHGPHQGYVIYKKGLDQQVVKFDGKVSTTMKEGRPETTMMGKYVSVGGVGLLAGIETEGTYTGYFTAEDKYHIDWEGTRTQPKDSMARAQK